MEIFQVDIFGLSFWDSSADVLVIVLGLRLCSLLSLKILHANLVRLSALSHERRTLHLSPNVLNPTSFWRT